MHEAVRSVICFISGWLNSLCGIQKTLLFGIDGCSGGILVGMQSEANPLMRVT